MKSRMLAIVVLATIGMAGCYTTPVVVDTPGPGNTVIWVPVPDPLPNPDTWTTGDRVRSALHSGMGSAAARIKVYVDANGVAFLSGYVATNADRERARAIAQGTVGVRSVNHSQLLTG